MSSPYSKKLFTYYSGATVFGGVLLFLFFANGAAASPLNDPSAALPQNIKLLVDDRQFDVPMETIKEWVVIFPANFYSPSYTPEIENVPHCATDKLLCALALTEKNITTWKISASISPEAEKIASYFESKKTELEQAPRNALFGVNEGEVVIKSPSANGYTIDEKESVKKVTETLIKFASSKEEPETISIPLPHQKQAPEITEKVFENLKATTLLGEGKSNFRGSPKNRIHNIQTAARRFDGILIAPNAEFSFVEALGPVDGDNGYLPELVIKHNRTEPEFGGGICQVSTTVFRGALQSGLKITARKNHAYAVSYYNPAGMDATIYIPKPDLRFVNNTPGYVLITLKIEGTELAYQLYGISDGRTVEVSMPEVINRTPDGHFTTIFNQKVIAKDQTTIIDDSFKSVYAPASLFPHPGEEVFTKKPEDWSKKQWEEYKKTHPTPTT